MAQESLQVPITIRLDCFIVVVGGIFQDEYINDS